MSQSYVALLRGINVGGNNILPMKQLVILFEQAGCSDVRNYIQSGNVIFRADEKVAKRLPSLVEKSIRKQFHFTAPIVVRSAAQLAKVVKGNPFLTERGVSEDALHVAFLAAAPPKATLSLLDPDRSLPDRFRTVGQEIFLCCPNGIGRSKLTNQYFDSKLGTTSTLRNWRTVRKLLELAGE